MSSAADWFPSSSEIILELARRHLPRVAPFLESNPDLLARFLTVSPSDPGPDTRGAFAAIAPGEEAKFIRAVTAAVGQVSASLLSSPSGRSAAQLSALVRQVAKGEGITTGVVEEMVELFLRALSSPLARATEKALAWINGISVRLEPRDPQLDPRHDSYVVWHNVTDEECWVRKRGDMTRVELGNQSALALKLVLRHYGGSVPDSVLLDALYGPGYAERLWTRVSDIYYQMHIATGGVLRSSVKPNYSKEEPGRRILANFRYCLIESPLT